MAAFLWLGAALVLALAVWTTARSSDLRPQAPAPTVTALPVAVAPPSPPVPTPRVTSTPAPPPAPRLRAPTPRPTPRPRATGPSYWIRFGPTEDLEVLSEMVDRLSRAYAVVGRIQTRWTVRGYRVVSGPVALRSAAEQRQALLAAVGLPAQLREVAGGYVLDFGQFPEAEAAEERARAVRARGFVAAAVPVRAPSYTVLVGPVPERVALAVARSLQAAGFSFSLSHRP